MSRLLVTSFQRDGVNLHEAQRFKAGALASKLLLLDRANELGRVPEVLREIPAKGQRGVLDVGSTASDRLYGLMQLSLTGGVAWTRVNRLKAFEDWLASLYAEDLTCWLAGGHHHTGSGGYEAMIWGTDPHTVPYRPYTGFGIQGGELSWFGFRDGNQTPRRIALPGAAAHFKTTSLLMIVGCNGVPARGPYEHSLRMAEAWRAFTKPALILGWWGVHTMPADANFKTKPHASTRLWDRLSALKATHGIADGRLDLLVKDHAPKVMEAWGQACWETYGKGPQRDLWWVKGHGGAGAVHPTTGVVYHANPDYAGTPDKPALLPTDITIP